jgi:hypothetical protein
MVVVGEDVMIEINGMEEEEEITWIDTMSEGGRTFTDESGNGPCRVGRRGGGGRYDNAIMVVGDDAMIEFKWNGGNRIENAIIDLNK